MSGRPSGPPGGADDIDALRVDSYLETVLATPRGAAPDAGDDAPDERTRSAAAALRRSLVPVHPSFRFEEVLAARLAAFGDARSDAAGVVVAFPMAGGAAIAGRGADGPDPLLPAIVAGAIDPADEAALDLESRLAAVRRPLLVGGAITSAALSLVGVAWVAWRATRRARVAADLLAGAT